MKVCNSSSEVCTHWPSPDLSRSSSAVRMPIAANSPVTISAIGMPTRIGPRPGSPVTDIKPAHALHDLVDAGPVLVGAVLAEGGNAGEDEARIDGLQRLVVEAKPRSSRRGGSSRPAHRPARPGDTGCRGLASLRRLSAMPRLLRCLFWKSESWRPEKSSGLPGRSMRMTLAPQSASWRTQTGPARAWVRSRTTRSSRAREAGCVHVTFSCGLASIRAMMALARGVEVLRRRQDSSPRWPCSCDARRLGSIVDLRRGAAAARNVGSLRVRIERVAQRLDALGRHVGRGRQRFAERSRRRTISSMTWRSSSLRRKSPDRRHVVKLLRLRLGLDQNLDLLVLDPVRIERLPAVPGVR